jgi:hypothetical protein
LVRPGCLSRQQINAQGLREHLAPPGGYTGAARAEQEKTLGRRLQKSPDNRHFRSQHGVSSAISGGLFLHAAVVAAGQLPQALIGLIREPAQAQQRIWLNLFRFSPPRSPRDVTADPETPLRPPTP